MDTSMIQIISGICAVVVLFILIQRRRKHVK
jgi:hypothetical protein